MALPASGQISLSQVNTELGRPATQAISMNEGAVRTLFGVASGGIGMSNGHGKSNAVVITLNPAGGSNYNVRDAAVAAGWNQTIAVIINVTNTGIMQASSTSAYGCYINGSFPTGSIINFTNNSYIVGKGGNGGSGAVGLGATACGYYSAPTGGAAGGPALYISASGAAVNITNNGTIGGGGNGGSGGWGGCYYNGGGDIVYYYQGGGGGGGGAGTSSGGAGGNPAPWGVAGNAGSAGGGGTYNSPGAGGGGGGPISFGQGAGAGGSSGGGLGGGAATVGAANATWLVTGTRLGAIN